MRGIQNLQNCRIRVWEADRTHRTCRLRVILGKRPRVCKKYTLQYNITLNCSETMIQYVMVFAHIRVWVQFWYFFFPRGFPKDGWRRIIFQDCVVQGKGMFGRVRDFLQSLQDLQNCRIPVCKRLSSQHLSGAVWRLHRNPCPLGYFHWGIYPYTGQGKTFRTDLTKLSGTGMRRLLNLQDRRVRIIGG